MAREMISPNQNVFFHSVIALHSVRQEIVWHDSTRVNVIAYVIYGG